MKLSNGTEVIAKPYQEEDAEEIVNLIIRNFREVNVKDYGEESIAALSATHDVNWFKGVAEYAHVYVFWNEGKIVGVGSISSFWGSPTESVLLTVFVPPEFHGQGIGRQNMNVIILGSRGCVSTPRACCNCRVCTEARQKRFPYARTCRICPQATLTKFGTNIAQSGACRLGE